MTSLSYSRSRRGKRGRPAGQARAGLGSRAPGNLDVGVVGDAGWTGHVAANRNTQDSYRGIPDLRLALSLRDGKLSGVCSAFVPNYFTLPFWVELTRQ